MDNFFEQNMRTLSLCNRELFSRLTACNASINRYTFSQSRTGKIVPSLVNPLHSMVDPEKEAQRMVSTISDDTGFLVFLGLGGGFVPEAALALTAAQITVIDFNIDGIAGLFRSKDYTHLLSNSRFSLLADSSVDEIKSFILEQYRPAIHGGIKVIPLRARIEADVSKFEAAAAAIEEAIGNIAADYSVQAHFGSRWFSNIIRNIKAAEKSAKAAAKEKIFPPVKEAAIAAAGPSLDQQMPLLAEYKSRQVFIISCDTALPALLYRGIKPDAVVSIDCQHISYYHFLGCDTRNVPLFLDIASPPLLSSLSPSAHFFSSGHPLAVYISQWWRQLPAVDTSGGNVTYACLSLAHNLGAQRITAFGADFSYTGARTYARGTYIYPFFEKKQNRLSPMESLFSAFLYRSPFLPSENKNCNETAQLRFYRQKFEEKAAAMNAEITAAPGGGAPVNLSRKKTHNAAPVPFAAGKARITGGEFLEQYCGKIAALPAAGSLETSGDNNYFQNLSAEDRQIFFTLLPGMAALKHRNPKLKTQELIEEIKRLSMSEIVRVAAV